MAITLRLYNNATQLGSIDLPPGAVSRITAILNEATPAANANRFLSIAWKAGRLEVREIGAKEIITAKEATLAADLATFLTGFTTDMPDS